MEGMYECRQWISSRQIRKRLERLRIGHHYRGSALAEQLLHKITKARMPPSERRLQCTVAIPILHDDTGTFSESLQWFRKTQGIETNFDQSAIVRMGTDGNQWLRLRLRGLDGGHMQ
jgi:hypothetical protein